MNERDNKDLRRELAEAVFKLVAPVLEEPVDTAEFKIDREDDTMPWEITGGDGKHICQVGFLGEVLGAFAHYKGSRYFMPAVEIKLFVAFDHVWMADVFTQTHICSFTPSVYAIPLYSHPPEGGPDPADSDYEEPDCPEPDYFDWKKIYYLPESGTSRTLKPDVCWFDPDEESLTMYTVEEALREELCGNCRL